MLRALVDTGAVGGSIYDWATLSAPDRQLLRAAMTHAFPKGVGSG